MLEYLLNLWKPIVEIFILWIAFYVLLLFLKGTRAIQVLRGLVVLVTAFFLAQRLGLHTINWILTKLFAIWVIGFLIIFQPELRRGLASLGQRPIFGFFLREERMIEELVEASQALSRKRIGALIALQMEAGLGPYLESGVPLDSKVSSELINTIFMPGSPLHDGGVVIEKGRIVAAGCLFPLTQNPRLNKTLGTRHRAAIGLTEETDSVVIIISEETGAISIAIEGRLTRDLDREGLARVLMNLYRPVGKRQTIWGWLGGGEFLKHHSPLGPQKSPQE